MACLICGFVSYLFDVIYWLWCLACVGSLLGFDCLCCVDTVLVAYLVFALCFWCSLFRVGVFLCLMFHLIRCLLDYRCQAPCDSVCLCLRVLDLLGFGLLSSCYSAVT